jgi:hypothetical protein
MKSNYEKDSSHQYESDRDYQTICHNMRKKAQSYTIAQISSDSYLQYITTARFPGEWRGSLVTSVLHRKE